MAPWPKVGGQGRSGAREPLRGSGAVPQEDCSGQDGEVDDVIGRWCVLGDQDRQRREDCGHGRGRLEGARKAAQTAGRAVDIRSGGACGRHVVTYVGRRPRGRRGASSRQVGRRDDCAGGAGDGRCSARSRREENTDHTPGLGPCWMFGGMCRVPCGVVGQVARRTSGDLRMRIECGPEGDPRVV